MSELIVESGKHRGRRIRLADGETLVGREADCPIRLATTDVSRHHCRLLVSAAGLKVEDLGSRNGTFVNDTPVRGVRRLSGGDRLRVGPVQFRVPDDPDAADDSEIVDWLAGPGLAPKAGAGDMTRDTTVVPGLPGRATEGDASATREIPAAPRVKPDDAADEQLEADAAFAAEVIRKHHAGTV